MGANKVKFDDPIKPIRLSVGGRKRSFDIDDPDLPDWITENELTAGGYPYDKRMKRKAYEQQLELYQMELVKLQYWLQKTGERVMVLFEGRDAAGKGGTIFVVRQYMNPRTARNVALTKPTETGFCTPQQHELFLEEAPHFEKGIVADGIRFFKFWLAIGQETQLKRFHDRRHSPLKMWKFSPMDVAGIEKWDDYTKARDVMFERTHSAHAPWTVVLANDKRRARLAVIRRLLLSIPYDGRDMDVVGEEDPGIISEPTAAIR